MRALEVASEPLGQRTLEWISEGAARSSAQDADTVLLTTALDCLGVDAGLCLSALGALSESSVAESFFDLVPPTPVMDRFAAYFYGLEAVLNESEDSVEKTLGMSCRTVLDKGNGG